MRRPRAAKHHCTSLLQTIRRPPLLKILIKAGADPRAINNEGKTPLDVEKPEYRDILSKAMMDKPLK